MISVFTSYTELEGYPIVNSQQKVARCDAWSDFQSYWVSCQKLYFCDPQRIFFTL